MSRWVASTTNLVEPRFRLRGTVRVLPADRLGTTAAHLLALASRRGAFPLEIRPRDERLDVFGQVFSGDEYGPVVKGRRADVILDGGANVGY